MSIFDIDNWREIGATLARNKTRTFLTAFGIFWGTAMLSLLWGVGDGFKYMLFSNFEGFASNSALVTSWRTTKPYKGYRKGTWWSVTTDDVMNLRRRVPELTVVSPIINRSASYRYKDKTYEGTLQGMEPNYTKFSEPVITSGRFLSDYDVANNSKVCVVGDNIASTLFVGVDPLGKNIDINNVSYRVVGTVKQRSDVTFGARLDESVLLPISTMRTAYNNGNRVDFIALVAQDGTAPGDLKDQIFQTLRQNHPLIHPEDTESVRFFDISEMFGQVTSIFSAFDFLLLFVGLSSLIAGVIGVGNIMWIVVKERTQEFGVRRAIGAKPRSILVQILSESAVLTTIAGVAGICFAVGVLELVTYGISAANPDLATDRFQLSFGTAVTILFLFLVLGGLAGMIPAYRAMKIKPIEALNDK